MSRDLFISTHLSKEGRLGVDPEHVCTEGVDDVQAAVPEPGGEGCCYCLSTLQKYVPYSTGH